ncbi:hypothetical protein PoB_006263100 [Plakobranchus ocellatus]|uniref:Uncharacterized protein n=1 Tax=Plakobranchus ocellatus TaxID=259542 RepID=A0AAV4CW91_9GAST|nr:hypothetical protein PoB_006263100 [Plakobranchus ocellatus]
MYPVCLWCYILTDNQRNNAKFLLASSSSSSSNDTDFSVLPPRNHKSSCLFLPVTDVCGSCCSFFSPSLFLVIPKRFQAQQLYHFPGTRLFNKLCWFTAAPPASLQTLSEFESRNSMVGYWRPLPDMFIFRLW